MNKNEILEKMEKRIEKENQSIDLFKDLNMAESCINLLIKEKEEYKKIIKLIESLPEIKGFNFSESPHSLSIYYKDENCEIDWGEKPIGSYRISDHWNFKSNGKIHCNTVENKYRENGFEVMKMTEKGYKLV